MTRLVHGQDALDKAINITQALFSGNVKELSANDIKQGFKDVPSYVPAADEELTLVELLVNAKISPSKRQAREDITNGAISINGDKVTDLSYVVSADDRIEDQFTVIRRGKKKYTLIKFA